MSRPSRARGASDEVALPLGDALDFLRRVWRLDHALERWSRRMERDLGVTGQQRLVLRCIGKYPGVTARQLSGLVHVDPGTMSATLRRLEEKGLVRKRQDPTDRRRLCLGLTEEGRALDAPTVGTLESAVDELLAKSNATEKAAGVLLLDRLVSILEAALEESR